MIDVRQFIKSLGDNAPAFFDSKPDTIRRWLKTGNVPIKAAQKVFTAYEAMSVSTSTGPEPVPQASPPVDNMDPMTHLPRNLDRRLPDIPVMAGGKLPDTIEISPTEQSFGNNLTRPGRAGPRPPMKLREEGGQKVAYVDNTPRAPTVLPPTIQNEGWAQAGPPLPREQKPEAKGV